MDFCPLSFLQQLATHEFNLTLWRGAFPTFAQVNENLIGCGARRYPAA
jgi:hypothetical protein